MKSDPADYELVAPGTLQAALSLLAEKPGTWLPIAGGTDVMVQYAACKLLVRKLVSIWNLPELRRIEVSAGELCIGAGCTYTDLRRHEIIAQEFPLLARAAGWIGGISNQNRGTIGGNIVNASPAADSLPALLAYEAAATPFPAPPIPGSANISFPAAIFRAYPRCCRRSSARAST
jgi:CO/xanthine dehydrogenase FAD-binding subunit